MGDGRGACPHLLSVPRSCRAWLPPSPPEGSLRPVWEARPSLPPGLGLFRPLLLISQHPRASSNGKVMSWFSRSFIALSPSCRIQTP